MPVSRPQAGRVTFCPLNRIAPEAVRYPGDLGTDAQPLIGRLKFDARFQKAVQQARRACCCAAACASWQCLACHTCQMPVTICPALPAYHCLFSHNLPYAL